MSEPNEFPPPPFTPAPLAPSERSGCRKALLFGCGGLFLVCALGLVAMVVKAPEIMGAMLGYLEEDYSAKLGPDVPAAERERFHRAFAAARKDPTKVMQDPTSLQAFQTQIIELGSKSQLSREDAAKLSGLLEKMSGTPSPAPPPGSGAPAPPPATSEPVAPSSPPPAGNARPATA